MRFLACVSVVDENESRVGSKEDVAGLDCDHAVHLHQWYHEPLEDQRDEEGGRERERH